MTIWRDIKDAPLDGTPCDLYVELNDNRTITFRITNCKSMGGEWLEFDRENGEWLPIGDVTPTRYAEITRPQEPIDWPTEPGRWWVNDGYGTEYWFVVTVSIDQIGANGGGLPFHMYKRGDLCRHRFLPATPPSFGA